MKRILSTLITLLFAVILFAQNENPYSQFGYEAPVMQGVECDVTNLIIFNTVTVSDIGWVEIDVKSRHIYYFSSTSAKYIQDTLHLSTLTRWLTTDPANQYHSPYIGMGNDPINGIDPDGARKVYYNTDGTYSHTTHNNFFHNLFAGNQHFIANSGYGYTQVSYAAFQNWQSDMFPQGWGSRAMDWQITPRGHEINPVDGSLLGGGALQPSAVADIIAFAPLGLLKGGVTATASASSRVFWSGGDDAMNEAMKYAQSRGMTTLEMTRAGKNLTTLTKNMPWDEAKPMWNRLSGTYANGTKGTAHVFQNAKTGVGVGSTWRTVEFPALQTNGVKIIYHNVH